MKIAPMIMAKLSKNNDTLLIEEKELSILIWKYPPTI